MSFVKPVTFSLKLFYDREKFQMAIHAHTNTYTQRENPHEKQSQTTNLHLDIKWVTR